MALIKCSECGKEISSKALACPNCGVPLGSESIVDPEFHGKSEGVFLKSLNCGCMVMLAVALFVIFGIVFGSMSAGAK